MLLLGDLSCMLIFFWCFLLLVVGIMNFVGFSLLMGLYVFLLIVRVGMLNWWFLVVLVWFLFWFSVGELIDVFMLLIFFCDLEERELVLVCLFFVEVWVIEVFLFGNWEFFDSDGGVIFLLLCLGGLCLKEIELKVLLMVFIIGFLFGLNFILMLFRVFLVLFFCNL